VRLFTSITSGKLIFYCAYGLFAKYGISSGIKTTTLAAVTEWPFFLVSKSIAAITWFELPNSRRQKGLLDFPTSLCYGANELKPIAEK